MFIPCGAVQRFYLHRLFPVIAHSPTHSPIMINLHFGFMVLLLCSTGRDVSRIYPKLLPFPPIFLVRALLTKGVASHTCMRDWLASTSLTSHSSLPCFAFPDIPEVFTTYVQEQEPPQPRELSPGVVLHQVQHHPLMLANVAHND